MAKSKEAPKKEAEQAESPKPKKEKAKGYIVISSFRDQNDFNRIYQKGEAVSHFDAERLASLQEKGLVKAL